MKNEDRKIEIRRLERERCLALAEYHKAAEKLDFIDYQLFKLKKKNREISGYCLGKGGN